MNARLSERPFVDGKTRLFGIIGDPIEQVKSPEILTARFHARGRNALMLPMHILPGSFDETMRGLTALGNLDGLIVTVPYKVRALAFVDRVMPSGKRIGAINAMRREPDGRWAGDMFDGRGMVQGLRNHGLDPRDLRVMQLGAGGAGSAIGDALAESGIASLTIFDVDEMKARALVTRIVASHPQCNVRYSEPALDAIDVLVNATPIGMTPGDGMPAAFDAFDRKLFVFDVVTHAEGTPLLDFAKQCGCRTLGGRAMVEGQADDLVNFVTGGN